MAYANLHAWMEGRPYSHCVMPGYITSCDTIVTLIWLEWQCSIVFCCSCNAMLVFTNNYLGNLQVSTSTLFPPGVWMEELAQPFCGFLATIKVYLAKPIRHWMYIQMQRLGCRGWVILKQSVDQLWCHKCLTFWLDCYLSENSFQRRNGEIVMCTNVHLTNVPAQEITDHLWLTNQCQNMAKQVFYNISYPNSLSSSWSVFSLIIIFNEMINPILGFLMLFTMTIADIVSSNKDKHIWMEHSLQLNWIPKGQFC